jgi:hypothetical protein
VTKANESDYAKRQEAKWRAAIQKRVAGMAMFIDLLFPARKPKLLDSGTSMDYSADQPAVRR